MSLFKKEQHFFFLPKIIVLIYPRFIFNKIRKKKKQMKNLRYKIHAINFNGFKVATYHE